MQILTQPLTIVKRIGEGSYGAVYLATDGERKYAVKCNYVDEDVDFYGCIREIDMLCRCNHPFIVRLEGVYFKCPFVHHTPVPLGYREDHLYLVFEAGEDDMETIMFQDQRDISGNVKLYMVQLLLALVYLHEMNIIHRDIKPANIVFFSPSTVKLCDLGMAKPHAIQAFNSPRAITYNYRAPELLFQRDYDTKADVWSMGCVFYEMLTHRRLIKTDKRETINNFVCSIPGICLREKEYLKSFITRLPTKANDELEFIPHTLPQRDLAIDLIRRMLVINPSQRASAKELLLHPYFEDLRSYISEHYVDVRPSPVIPTIHAGPLRDVARIIIESYIDKMKDYRVLFHALDLYDRYLDAVANSFPYDPLDLSTVVYVCVYIALKYFSITCEVPSFIDVLEMSAKHLVHTIDHKRAKQLEHILVTDVFRFRIYRETLYESVRELPHLSRDEIIRLLRYYLNLPPTSGLSVDDIYACYRLKETVTINYNGKQYTVDLNKRNRNGSS
jgi:serine/threonine protein kinase